MGEYVSYKTEQEKQKLITENSVLGMVVGEELYNFSTKERYLLFIPKPMPRRDLAVEIDELKAKVEALESAKPVG